MGVAVSLAWVLGLASGARAADSGGAGPPSATAPPSPDAAAPSPSTAPASAAPAPRPVARAAVDNENPTRPTPVAVAGGRMVQHPGSGFGFGTGFGLGGDKLATATSSNGSTEDMRAGDGFLFDLEGAVTPFWTSGDAVGFGIGAEIGVKYRSLDASNGSLSFTRYPALAFAQLVAPTGDRGSFLLRAGAEVDMGSSLGLSSGLGSASADVSSQVGFVAEIGAWVQMTPGAALTATFRFTSIHYKAANGSTLDGTSGGVGMGLLFGSS